MSGKKKTRAAKPNEVKLEARLTIAQAPALHKQLLEFIAAGRPLTIDVGAVEEVDTAALQLLLAAKQTFEARQVALHWRSSSPALQRAAGLIGLANALGFETTTN